MKTRVNLQNVLSAAAIALAGVALLRGSVNLDGASTAVAQPPARFSAGEQRIEMIGELRELNVRMARIEAALNSGLTVRVIEAEDKAN